MFSPTSACTLAALVTLTVSAAPPTQPDAVLEALTAAAPAVIASASTPTEEAGHHDTDVSFGDELSDGATLTPHEGLGVNIRIRSHESVEGGKEVTPGVTAYNSSSPTDYFSAENTVSGGFSTGVVIGDRSSPVEFEYHVSLTDGTAPRLETTDDGAIMVFDRWHNGIAVVEVPWAFDSNGRTVGTHYAVVEDRIVQTVEHRQDEVSYPVVADPAVRGTYIRSIEMVGAPNGITTSVFRTSNPDAIKFPDAVYDEYKLWVNSSYQGRKYRDQLVCHVVNAWTKQPWNLDSWRPDVGYAATVAAGCNP